MRCVWGRKGPTAAAAVSLAQLYSIKVYSASVGTDTRSIPPTFSQTMSAHPGRMVFPAEASGMNPQPKSRTHFSRTADNQTGRNAGRRL